MQIDHARARSEGEITSGLHGGDPKVVEEIVQKYGALVYRYLMFLTRSPEEAADLVQETWVRVLERGHQYQGGRPVDRWLLAIAHNLAIDRLRTASRKREVALETTDNPAERFRTDAPSPYDQVRRGELRRTVQTAVRRLGPVLQGVIRLRFEGDLSLDDIARELDVPPGTVRSRLHRGFSALRSWTAQVAES